MSGTRVLLKVICVLLTILGLLEVVLGVLLFMGSSVPELALTFIRLDSQTISGAVGADIFGATFLVTGAVNFVIGMLGWRGANRPSKIGPFFWLSIIGAVLSVVGLVYNFTSGIVSPTSVASTVIVVVCAILANSIRNKSKGIGKVPPKEQ